MSDPTLGLTKRYPFAKYLAEDGMNFSTLKEMAHSPMHFLHRRDTELPPTAPMTLGTASHTAVLEPHRFLAEYALWDERTEGGNVRPRRGKDWETFVAANEGKTIVRAEEHGIAMAVRDAIRGHQTALRYLRKGDPEVMLRWRDAETDRLCKGRIDWLTHVDGCDVLVGLKTARDARPIGFGNAAARLGYHLQWAFYRDGYEAVTGRIARVVEIVVESKAPHDVVVYLIPAEVIEAGRDEYRRLLVQLDECERADKWPGSAEEEQVLSLPSWVYHAEEDLADLGLEVA